MIRRWPVPEKIQETLTKASKKCWEETIPIEVVLHTGTYQIISKMLHGCFFIYIVNDGMAAGTGWQAVIRPGDLFIELEPSSGYIGLPKLPDEISMYVDNLLLQDGLSQITRHFKKALCTQQAVPPVF